MAMGIGQQALASLTGNVETALLVIHDYRQKAAQMSAGVTGGLSAAETLSSLNQSRIRATAAALETGSPPTYPGSQDRALRVQFNPSELTLNASAVPKSEQDGTTGRSRTMAVEDAKLALTVMLYFDDMQTYDAFMWDKFTAGLTAQGIANLAKMGMEAAGKGKVYSVQGQVEALVAALRNPYTRLISFRWADFTFIGQLNTVRANYTMFSPSGRPIRAQVLLRIQHEMDPNMLKGWYSSFEKAFGGDTSNLVKTEQNMGNLLNLSL
ncbi:CIS tube protein [Oscillibacter sp.]|uniref:CIS tube protein n=1 Tax=Oscillibacter sp. TaxID=1945593 RepID=UPI001B78956E|nr:hypothetical protein [Oscillibacter sp.]MBP3509855.1 hypothetical protein [Oscillibacter sp.]